MRRVEGSVRRAGVKRGSVERECGEGVWRECG